MLNKAYKISLKFFVFVNVLCIKYKNGRFSVSKFHIIKTILIVSLTITLILIASQIDSDTVPEKYSNFSKIFIGLIQLVPLLMMIVHFILQLMFHNSIAKVFNYFLTFKRLADERNYVLNLRKFKADIWKITLVFGFIIFPVFCATLTFLIKKLSIFNFSIQFSGLTVTSFNVMSICFLCATILHFDFLLDNFIYFMEHNLSNYYHNHDDCEEIFILLNSIHAIFKTFNKSFGAIITVFTVNLVLNLLHVVSELIN